MAPARSLVVLATAFFAAVAVPPAPKCAAEHRASKAPTAQFAGRWQTTFGDLTVKQTGMAASGEYRTQEGPASITGSVSGLRMTFTYNEPSDHGHGWFEMNDDDHSFVGRWTSDRGDEWKEWTGARPGEASFSGLWTTDAGPMRLRANRGACEGVLQAGEGVLVLRGLLDDNNVSFSMTNDRGERGEGRLALNPNGDRVTGSFKLPGQAESRDVTGTRDPSSADMVSLFIIADTKLAPTIPGQAGADWPHVKVTRQIVSTAQELRRALGQARFTPGPVALWVRAGTDDESLTIGAERVPPSDIAACLKGATNLRLLHISGGAFMAGEGPKHISEAFGSNDVFPITGYESTPPGDAEQAAADLALLMLVVERRMPAQSALGPASREAAKPGTLGIFPPGT